VTKKIAILATDNFEDSELSEPYARFRDAGFKVLIIGPSAGSEIAGKNSQFKVASDLAVESVSVDDFDALVIPGGYSPDRLRLNPSAVEFTRAFGLSGKPIAAICHAAQLLISAGLVSGRKLTCWPSVKIDVINAGGNYIDEPVVIDGNLITSRKPADLPQFIDAVISSLECEEQRLSA